MNGDKSSEKGPNDQTTFYVGIDVRKKRWVVTIRALGLELKTFSMSPSPGELLRHLDRHWPGWICVTCQEAGCCGFWIHNAL